MPGTSCAAAGTTVASSKAVSPAISNAILFVTVYLMFAAPYDAQSAIQFPSNFPPCQGAPSSVVLSIVPMTAPRRNAGCKQRAILESSDELPRLARHDTHGSKVDDIRRRPQQHRREPLRA